MRVRRVQPWFCAVLAVGGLALCVTALAGAPDPPPATDPGQAAHEVFQDPEFWWKRIDRVEYSSSWLARALNALGDLVAQFLRMVWEFLSKFFFNLFNFSLGGDWSAGTPFIWVVAAVLLGWVLWKLSPYILQWLRRGEPAPGRKETLEYQQLPEASIVFRQANQACHAGRYAEAVRLALLALIAHLQHEGLLRYDPTRTNREYRLDLRPAPELAGLFGEVARPYERIWYGQFPATHAEAERVLDLCRTAVIAEEPAHE